jgi:hypothetical protein
MISGHARRSRRPGKLTGRRRPRSPRLLVLVAVGVGVVLPVSTHAPRARAANVATATATVSIVFKSVTISTNQLTYTRCTGGDSTGTRLGFPNGRCTSGPVTVTNGAAPSTIVVSGTDAAPSDAGKSWTLCGGAGAPACTGKGVFPGVDQFFETDANVKLGPAGSCDVWFAVNPCGSATPGQATTESLLLLGPEASTDQSPTFTTQITWTAS